MGLRQLYFLLGGLMTRLVFLKHALSIILAFIGVKLILHAMHENELPFINGGHHIEWAPVIPTFASLGFIVATIVVAVLASLLSPAGKRAKLDAELAADAEKARTGGPEH
jgi:tellurite resistance protein TerC